MSNPCGSLTKEQMAWVFERLDEDVPLKALAWDLNINVHQLYRRVSAAEKHGFDAWTHPMTRKKLANSPKQG